VIRRPAFRGIQTPTDTRTTEGALRWAAVFVALVVVAAGFPPVHAQSLRAATTVYPVCQYSSYHNYAFQAVSNTSWGEYGEFQTLQPQVPNIAQADSVSHLYMYLNQNDTSDSDPFANTAWFEDGYYVGAGAGSAPINVSTPHFFRTYSYAGTGYHEGDDGSTPAGAIPYELLYAGYNYSLGSYDWQYYYANLSTPRDTIHMKNFPFARPSAGGEVGQTYKMSVQMRTRGVPAFQIKGRDSVWRNWTTFFATKICADSGFRYTVEGAYQDFAIEGYAAGVGQ